jgi:hypothetical protein
MPMAYWPFEGVPLSTDLSGHIATGSESDVVQMLLDHFVQATSDEKLHKAADEFKPDLNLTISRFPKGL